MSPTANFEKTIRELRKYLAIPIQNDRDRAGVIQAFEFTFEQCWKSIQKIAGTSGVAVGSPKAAFTYALENAWIDPSDEGFWLEMIKDRNLTSHTYQEDLAKEVFGRIRDRYVAMFDAILVKMK